jgi:hypothetical protein
MVCEVVGGAALAPRPSPQSTDDRDEGTKKIRQQINEWNKKNNHKPMTSKQFLDLVVDMDEFLEEKASLKNCEDKENGGRFQQCSCLSIIRDASNRSAVARFCVNFLQRKRNDQNQTVMDWYRYAEANRVNKNKQWYLMPYDVSDCENADVVAEALGSHKICRSAMMTLVQFGKRRMQSIKNNATGNGVAQEHGNKGKRKRLQESDPKMIGVRAHFDILISVADEAPRATKIIEKVVDGHIQRSTRDDDDKAVYLPFSMGIRSCYYRYLKEQGYSVKVNQDGSLETTPLPGGQEKPIISLATYYNIWKRDYDYLKVSRPVENICS